MMITFLMELTGRLTLALMQLLIAVQSERPHNKA
jgi:hypothetical protein